MTSADPSAVGGMRACLVDVYETVLSCDFSGHREEMPELAGVDPETWNQGFSELGPAVGDGRISMADAYRSILAGAGIEPDEDHVRSLVRRDRELLLETSVLHDDAVPFLEELRGRGISTAFVSNCAENTRGLLDHLGLSPLVDELVLSCEVGVSKPEPTIYRAALDVLGVPPGQTVFVDDQPTYCDGAAALGLRAVRIWRGDVLDAAGDDRETVSSLTELVGLF